MQALVFHGTHMLSEGGRYVDRLITKSRLWAIIEWRPTGRAAGHDACW